MGKLTISMVIFLSYVSHYQRVPIRIQIIFLYLWIQVQDPGVRVPEVEDDLMGLQKKVVFINGWIMWQISILKPPILQCLMVYTGYV